MNKKFGKILLLSFIVGFFESEFAGCLSPLSNNPEWKFGGNYIDTLSLKNKFIDVAYASKSETQKLDIYLPDEGQGPFPVIMAIHGGGFFTGSKNGEDLESCFRA